MTAEACACGAEQPYLACCGRFIEGSETPQTPEALMRSRYTAYTRVNIDYIKRTMRSPALDRFDAIETRKWAASLKWEKLNVVSTHVIDDKGYVEFYAHFKGKNKKYAMREVSEFHRIDGIWYYVNGEDPKSTIVHQTPSLGRNDPCPCQSGRKYKKCCGF
jgi:SEC-C motif-containing protein